MACATPFLLDLVYHPALAQRGSMSSMRVFLCGGASVPRQLMHDARAALPHTFTTPLWGMTECGGVSCCPLDAPEDKLERDRRYGRDFDVEENADHIRITLNLPSEEAAVEDMLREAHESAEDSRWSAASLIAGFALFLIASSGLG